MTRVEYIYIKQEQEETTTIDPFDSKFKFIEEKESELSPEIEIHKTPKHRQENKNSNNKKPKSKRIFSIAIISILLFMSLGTLLNMGYLPVTALQTIHKPVGNSHEIDPGSYMHELPQLSDIPSLDKIKYKIYGTDASVKTIISNYKNILKDEGYELEYKGVVRKKGVDLHYLGFTKNLLAVGIVISDDVDDILRYETAVLYTTGAIFDYQEISNWYKSNLM